MADDDDDRLTYFAEALKARGIEIEPWKLQIFAEKKDRGETEADIIRQGNEGTRRFKSRLLGERILQGTALGAVAVPVADWLKEGRPSWHEVVKRSPKTATVGVLLGGAVGWIAGKRRNKALADAIENRVDDLKHTTHEMEIAWTEAMAERAAVSKDSGPAR